MILSYLKEIKNIQIKSYLESKLFLYYSCGIVLLLNLYLTSITNIGSDTAIYINFGKKIAEGGRYYFDYFESNLPFNFYPYALFYIISQKTGINNIIIVQIAFYLMFFVMIYCSSKIIKKTTIYDQKIIVNFLFLSFFIGFLLRSPGIRFNEIGTKTSYLMLMLVPYLLYSFEHKQELSTTDKFIRGIIMALIPCFKPHYLIILISVESYRIYHKKLFFKLFNQLDYLVFVMFGLLALNWVIYFEREYFEFMVLMWSRSYTVYNESWLFLTKWLYCLINFIIPSSSFIIIFSRIRNIEYNLKILLFAVIGSAITLLLEGLISIDQISAFFFVVVIFMFYLITNQDFIKLMNFSQRKFLICSIIFCSLLGIKVLISILFGVSSILFSFWILCPFIIIYLFHQKQITYKELVILLFIYLFFVIIVFLVGIWFRDKSYALNLFIMLNILIIITLTAFYEKKYFAKNNNNISNFSFVVIFGSILIVITYFAWSYKCGIDYNDQYRSPNNNSDALAYYLKKYAPNKNHHAIIFSTNIPKYPIYNYLEKYNENKLLTFFLSSYYPNKGRYEEESIDINIYSSDDLRTAIDNKNNKMIIFIDIDDTEVQFKKCSKDIFENILQNYQFKKIFLEKFKFLVEYKSLYNEKKLLGDKIEINNKIYYLKSSQKINNQVIIYVRKEGQ